MRARKTEGSGREAVGSLLLTAFCLLLTACFPLTRPVVKIALVAPFEGRYREVGYEVIYAVRLAVREANANHEIAGYSVELLALDDSGDVDMATEQARKVAADPQVAGVIGHWLDETTLAAAREYAAVGIPVLATTSLSDLHSSAFRLWPTDAALRSALPDAAFCPTPCDSLEDLSWLHSPTSNLLAPIAGPPLWMQPQFAALAGDAAEGVYVIAAAPLPADSTDPSFADRYHALSNGVEPRSNAVLAYDAARLLFEAIERDMKQNGAPTRAGVMAALEQSNYSGLSGPIRFDEKHNWKEARGWVYQWRNGKIIRP
jgi:ABC-type branched-subunit amino acid transport system substrate-binding protein